jgi:lipopolysaccharide/colanic/teichoic acid biosynthesis glycosyltransferase
MYKLRTMTAEAEAQQAALRGRNEAEGPVFKLADDPRVTPFGRFLRTSSIDELPQLWNVLKGDMSLVGPRPLPCYESDGCLPWQRARLDVTPGMTGLWQVSGRSNVPLAPWVRMDLEYARTRSPWRDLALLAKTIPAVLFRRGSL